MSTSTGTADTLTPRHQPMNDERVCDYCHYLAVQYTRNFDKTECEVCKAERRIADPRYDTKVYVYELTGVDRGLYAYAFSRTNAQMNQSLHRAYAFTLSFRRHPHEALTDMPGVLRNQFALYEWIEGIPGSNKIRRDYYAVVPGPQKHKPYVVRLGNVDSHTTALTHYLRGLLTDRELLAGVLATD